MEDGEDRYKHRENMEKEREGDEHMKNEVEENVEKKSGCNKKILEDVVPAGNDGGRRSDVVDDAVAGDKQEVITHTWKVPDGGWGWVVVVSALVVSLIVDGLSYTFGLFLGEFERAFQAPKSTIALASSMQVGIYLFVGPLVSALTNRFGCRSVIITGSFIAGLGFIASSWSTNVTMLILTYGVAGGIGFGLMYLPAIVAVSIYFENRRAVATGIAVCGSGIGTFLLAPATGYLLFEYNWRWTLLLLGGLVLQGMIFGALVRPLDLQRGEVLAVIPEDKTSNKQPRANGAQASNLIEKSEGLTKAIRKKAFSVSTDGDHEKEEVPLMTIADADDIVSVLTIQPLQSSIENKSRNLFFSSTPAIQGNTASNFFQAEQEKESHHKTVSPSALYKSAGPPRRRTQSTSERTDLKSTLRARAHAPVGLAIISLSDANLNQIREDVHVPLSRKDIHLSGPLVFPEADSRVSRGEPGKGLYIQSIKSITSLAEMEDLGIVSEESRGLWTCLPRSARETMEEMFGLSILKEKSYWCVLLGNFFCMLGFYVPFVYIPDRAEHLGIPEDKAAFLISIIGITNTVGRVMTGVLINFLNLDCAMVTSGALLVAGVTTVVCPFCHSYSALAAASAIFGVCVAAYISLCSVLLCELLGVESLTNAFGFVILFRGVACIMGPPIAGAIIDATGLFDPSFYVGGGMIALGGLFHVLLLIPCTRRRENES